MDVSYHRKRMADFAAGMRVARELAARERLPRDELESHRRARLNHLARHAAQNSPFWADRLAGATRRGDVDLSAVPPLTKAELMEHWDDAVTDRRLKRDDLLEYLEGLDRDAFYMGEYRVMTTSGSSGLKGLFAYDRKAWRSLLGQFFRYNEMIGIKPRLPRRFRIAAIGGAAPTHMTQRIAATAKVGVHRVLPLPVTMPVPELVERLNEFQPNFINAFPSVACLLADEQEAGRLHLSLSIISTSSELRTAEMSERIERAFGVKPFDMFGSTEGLWGCECEEHAGIHLFDDMCIVENLGDRLLVTNLFNSAQPLIRFEITDVMTFAGDPCPCGRTLTRVASIEGRTDDVLRLPGAGGNDVPIHPMQFGVVTADRDVREFQVVQNGTGLRLRLVLRDGADADAAGQRVRARVCERLGAAGVDSPQVEVELENELERSAAGKLPVVVAKR
jgi:phenylacetate-coenzyme A ligase PaaK-like adenylate-forming protein